jgi:hypothetical protein
MKIFQGRGNLSGIEAGIVLGNALAGSSLEGAEELSTAAVFHAEVEVVLGLEGVV